jgi:hypothetical protein
MKKRRQFSRDTMSRQLGCEKTLAVTGYSRGIAPGRRRGLSTGLDGCWLEIAGRRLLLPPVFFRRAFSVDGSVSVEARCSAYLMNADGNGGAMGKNRPVKEIRLGTIRATIWQNESEQGGPWFRVSITRRYKNGNEWADTPSFSRDDLPVVGQAAAMAFGWMWEQEAASACEDNAAG